MAASRTLPTEHPKSSSQYKAPEPNAAPFALTRPHTIGLNSLSRHVFIVLVDDNPADILLVREALVWHEVKSELLIARDGDEAINLLGEIDSQLLPCPDLVVLDLNLPRKTGFDVLEFMRSSPRCGKIPVAILSSSDAPSDQHRAELLGASRYFQKPSNLQDFLSIGAKLKEMLLPLAGH